MKDGGVFTENKYTWGMSQDYPGPGLVIFLFSLGLLFWNEGNFVKAVKGLTEGLGQVVSIDPGQVNPANEGRLVHVTGLATTTDVLSDPDFNVSVNALALKRTAEMYQWVKATGQAIPGGHSYAKAWSKELVPSGRFKSPARNMNPEAMPYPSEEFLAHEVTLGAFTLPQSLVKRIDARQDVALQSLPVLPVPATLDGNALYLGKDPADPQIGDERVSFSMVKPVNVSILAQQKGATFAAFPTADGQMLKRLEIGTRSAQEMITLAREENTRYTNVLRLLCLVIMYIGLEMAFVQIPTRMSALHPVLSSLSQTCLRIGASPLALTIALMASGLTWVFYDILVGGGLIILGLGIFFAASRWRAATV